MDKKEQTRIRVKRYRDKKKALQDVTLQTESVTQIVTQGHKVMFNDDSSVLDLELLYDRRERLTNLINSLNSDDKTRRLLSHIRYGTGGPTLDRVSVALSCLP